MTDDVDPRDRPEPDAYLAVACPTCHAGPHEPCGTFQPVSRGQVLPHVARIAHLHERAGRVLVLQDDAHPDRQVQSVQHDDDALLSHLDDEHGVDPNRFADGDDDPAAFHDADHAEGGERHGTHEHACAHPIREWGVCNACGHDAGWEHDAGDAAGDAAMRYHRVVRAAREVARALDHLGRMIDAADPERTHADRWAVGYPAARDVAEEAAEWAGYADGLSEAGE